MTSVEKLTEEAKKVGQLSILAKMKVRYTWGNGPDPIPFEVVLSYQDFQDLVEKAKK
jgi:hypothetical protein